MMPARHLLVGLAAFVASGACARQDASGAPHAGPNLVASAGESSGATAPALPAGAELIAASDVDLAGRRVLVQRFRIDCAKRADGLLLPRLPSTDGQNALPRLLPSNCAEEVERIWVRSSGSLQLLGAYPVRGVQLMGRGVVRRFTSVSRFVGNQIVIADHTHWYWFSGAWRPGAKNGVVEEELQAESEATNERVLRVDRDRLVPVHAEIEAEPARPPHHQAWLATSFATTGVCATNPRGAAP